MSWDTTPAADTGEWGTPAGGANDFAASQGYSNDARNGEADGAVDGAADEYGGGNGDGCFNCGQAGHMKSECTEPRSGGDNSGLCYNCGQEGHNKADCTNERVAQAFSGTCRLCDQEGHRASDCPSAGPQACKNCEEEGHSINECKNPRKIDRSAILDADPEQSWQELIAAVAEKDIDDFKTALEKYLKTCPDLTYLALEEAFRVQAIPVYIIALERELTETYTNMDLQGNLGKTYSISYRWSAQPRRPKERDGWPSVAENKERLQDAGEAVDVRMTKCNNCNALGHGSRSCPEEKQEPAARTQVMCFNCDQVGHRVRDCPNERPDRFTCRNCQQSGHSSKECPEPRTGGGPCRNCNQEGHRAAECTNERVLICRNCDAEGHVSKECTEKKDWSRVKCSNCEQMGHSKVRCKEPLKEEENAETGGNTGYGDVPDSNATPADDGWGSGAVDTNGW